MSVEARNLPLREAADALIRALDTRVFLYIYGCNKVASGKKPYRKQKTKATGPEEAPLP